MDKLFTLDGWDLLEYASHEIPGGFLLPTYRLVAPDGHWRNVSADKLTDALDRLFEECA